MNKIAMGVGLLAASLGLSGMVIAGSEAPATGSVSQPVAAAAVGGGKGQKSPEASQGAVVAEAKGMEQKAGPAANKQKPEATTKTEAKPTTPAPVEGKDSTIKK